MCLKETSYANQGCIYLIKKYSKTHSFSQISILDVM